MMASVLGFQDKAALESSFKEWCAREDNRPAVDAAQAHEVRQALRLRDAQAQARLMSALGEARPMTRTALAPFLRVGALRRVVQTFGNIEAGSSSGGSTAEQEAGGRQELRRAAAALDAWAANPRVLQMLKQAKSLLDDGQMTEDGLEHHMLMYLKAPGGECEEHFEAAATRTVTLPAQALVTALNEQLDERRKGSAALKSRHFEDALKHYRRAVAVTEFVRGANPADQLEVESNHVAALAGLAAAHFGLQAYGAVLQCCNKALQLDPANDGVLMRRARAHAMRGEYEAAENDIVAAEQVHGGLGPTAEQGDDLREMIARLRLQDQRRDRHFCSRMFGA